MANNLAILFCHQGILRSALRPQGVNNACLVPSLWGAPPNATVTSARIAGIS